MIAFFLSTIAGFVTGEARQTARRAVRAAIFYTLAVILGVIGLGFLFAAGFMEVAEHFGPQRAAVGIGAGFLVLALIIVIIHMVTRRVRIRSATKRRKDEMASVATAAAVALLPLLLSGKGVRGLLMAPTALIAYAIFRENFAAKRRRRLPDEDDSDR